MVRVESAENWPGMKNSQCEVVGGEKEVGWRNFFTCAKRA